jgi:hypothetical protein
MLTSRTRNKTTIKPAKPVTSLTGFSNGDLIFDCGGYTTKQCAGFIASGIGILIKQGLREGWQPDRVEVALIFLSIGRVFDIPDAMMRNMLDEYFPVGATDHDDHSPHSVHYASASAFDRPQVH